jgi:hypothetical protein
MFAKIRTKYHPGQAVAGGMYWNRKTWELVDIPEEGGELPATEGIVYHRLPILLLMTVGPFVGLAFVLFLPVAVPVVLGYLAVKAIWKNIGRRPAAGGGRVQTAH